VRYGQALHSSDPDRRRLGIRADATDRDLGQVIPLSQIAKGRVSRNEFSPCAVGKARSERPIKGAQLHAERRCIARILGRMIGIDGCKPLCYHSRDPIEGGRIKPRMRIECGVMIARPAFRIKIIATGQRQRAQRDDRCNVDHLLVLAL
jgi:hypothetical protein